MKLLISGHCDERGSEEYNLTLGDTRADTVRDRLERLGVQADRIRTISYGKRNPSALRKRILLATKPPRALLVAAMNCLANITSAIGDHTRSPPDE
jgi:peptidoglycan-associated lipoprotein